MEKWGEKNEHCIIFRIGWSDNLSDYVLWSRFNHADCDSLFERGLSMPCDIAARCPSAKIQDKEKRKQVCKICQRNTFGGVERGKDSPALDEIYRERAKLL